MGPLKVSSRTQSKPPLAGRTQLGSPQGPSCEIESIFDELKTHQRRPRTVLHSKSPDLVLQEIRGRICCHYAIRPLRAEAAADSGHDSDRVSFAAALRITGQTAPHGRLSH